MMKMFRSLLAACLIALACAAGAQTISISPTGGPFTPPNVALTCGADSTTAIQAALNNTASNRGTIALPPCSAAGGCFIISATLQVPSNVSVLGTGKSVTCIKAATALNAPIFQNANSGGGGGSTLNSNIEIGFLTIDGNGSNQTFGLANACIYFIGVDRPSVHDIEVDNCISTAIRLDGNSSTTTTGGFVNNIFINTTIGNGSNPIAGTGLQVSNAQRGMQVANVTTNNTHGYGVLIDASEGNWSSIHSKAAGTGLTCPNSGTTTVDNPGGGAASQSGWTPCAAGIYIRNVSDMTGVGLTATEGQYYGIIVTGCRHCALSSLVATDNSLKTSGTWDDLHLDLNVFLGVGRGESHNLTINGAVLGANGQLNTTNDPSKPTTRYGLFMNDGIAGSIGDATLIGGGTTCTLNDALSNSGGTSTIAAKWTAATVTAGVVQTLKHDFTTGGGVYTVLPANPVTLTGGTCGTAPTANLTWSQGYLIGIIIGQTVTAAKRLPAFITNWTVTTVP